MGLKERAAATMAAGYRVYRVDSGILPSTGGARRAAARAVARAWRPGRLPADRVPAGGGPSVFDSRARIPQIIKAVEQIREGVGPGRQLDDRSAPEVRLPRGGGSLPAHGAVPAVLRRRPGPRRTVPHADPEAAAADDRAAGARRRVGHASGVQPARRTARHRLRARVAAERRRHHRDAQDHGAVRHAQGRHRAALHRPHRDRRRTCTR